MNNKFKYCPIEKKYMIGLYSVQMDNANFNETIERFDLLMNKHKGKTKNQILNETIINLSSILTSCGLNKRLTDRELAIIISESISQYKLYYRDVNVIKMELDLAKAKERLKPVVKVSHWYERMPNNVREIVINFSCMTKRVRDTEALKSLKESVAQNILREEMHKFYGQKNMFLEIRKTYSISPMNIEHLINWMNGKPNKFSDGE